MGGWGGGSWSAQKTQEGGTVVEGASGGPGGPQGPLGSSGAPRCCGGRSKVQTRSKVAEGAGEKTEPVLGYNVRT